MTMLGDEYSRASSSHLHPRYYNCSPARVRHYVVTANTSGPKPDTPPRTHIYARRSAPREVVEGLAPGDVVHEERARGPAVVGTRDGAERLLARLQAPHSRSYVDCGCGCVDGYVDV